MSDVAAVIAWCDHIESNVKKSPHGKIGASGIYADGLRDGILECLAQVRQAALHGFDPAALDGGVAYVG